MKKLYKALALLLVAVLLVGGTFAATVAWMTADAPDKKNVFTVGDIAISLEEETGVVGDGATVTDRTDGADYVGVMPGDKLIKKATVTNDGDVPAYVALTVTVNNADLLNYAIDGVYELAPYNYDAGQIQTIYDLVFEGWGLRYNKVDAAGNALGMRLTNKLATNEILLHVDSVKVTDLDNDYYFYAYNNWLQTEAEKENTAYGRFPAADGFYPVGNAILGLPAMEDYELRYTYFLHLDPGEEFTPFDGLNAPEFFNNDQMKLFDGLEIDIEAAAIQADNFATAQAAFEALYGLTTPEIPDAVHEGVLYFEDESGETATVESNGGDTVYRGILSDGKSAVTSVTVGEGITRLNDRALCKAPSLTTVSLPSTLTYIDESVFQQSGITSIEIPENVTYIGKQALGACSNLETIVIKAKDVTIANYVARACANLKEVYIYSDSVTFESGSMYFTNKENADASGITFYVGSQEIADVLYNAFSTSHSYGLLIKSLDGATAYYDTLK